MSFDIAYKQTDYYYKSKQKQLFHMGQRMRFWYLLYIYQGSHKLWKSWKIRKKSSMHGKVMEFENTKLKIHGKIKEFCEII